MYGTLRSRYQIAWGNVIDMELDKTGEPDFRGLDKQLFVLGPGYRSENPKLQCIIRSYANNASDQSPSTCR